MPSSVACARAATAASRARAALRARRPFARAGAGGPAVPPAHGASRRVDSPRFNARSSRSISPAPGPSRPSPMASTARPRRMAFRPRWTPSCRSGSPSASSAASICASVYAHSAGPGRSGTASSFAGVDALSIALAEPIQRTPVRATHDSTLAAMPELPEVETTRRGLAPHVEGRRVAGVILRRPDLRWPIPAEIRDLLPGQRIEAVRRRAKYLLLDTAGRQRAAAPGHVRQPARAAGRHAGARARPRRHRARSGRPPRRRVLRFNDPRRFGCLLWQPPGETHELLRGLGPEPLSDRLRRRLPVRAAAAVARRR